MKLPKKIEEELQKEFEKYNPTEKQKEKIRDKAKERYKKSCYESGEALGIVGAHSISEPATQLTMRTYHLAGAAGIQVTLGLPRLIEIVDARKKLSTPTMKIYLEDDYNNEEGAKEVAKKIKRTKLKDVVKRSSLDLMNLSIELEIDSEKLKDLNLEYEDLKKKVRIKNINVEIEGNILKIVPKKEMNLRKLQKLKIKVMDSRLKGIKNVSHLVVKQYNNNWIIDTLGSDLRKVLKINGVDKTRTISNDVNEIKKVLGIEAARNSIIEEAHYTLAQQGLDVDIRHIILLADTMTATGKVQAIGRYGVAGAKGSVLARANFEVTLKHLTTAALTGEVEKLNSILDNIIVNQIPPIGTGMCDITLSPKKKK